MGFEPTTSAVTGRRSNQLSHRAKFSYPQNQIPKICYILTLIIPFHRENLL